ncbi:hypothetical protein P8625_01865 [Tenacibaculum tangerinum]|uniref:DUF6896 domain-containing protein n=1 Tax=Tenacibaculum tangerinum TaxID=3038772 RepID=A0ABY8L3C5_9FLAO|nr:hypothetical protein [Tenacibaculum tangerinum]WGH75938.1 hypothetical protein P8625_01865 [Tenacibaculum tangerinum]
MEEIIRNYILFIKKFEGVFNEKYNIVNGLWSDIDKSVSRKGNIGDYKYNFHGRGCRIEYNNIICEYDSGFIDKATINFSVWKLFKFIETNPNLSNMSMNDVYSGILDLIEKKIVEKSLIEEVDTGTYDINKDYLRTLTFERYRK